jgi:hypothetical protein
VFRNCAEVVRPKILCRGQTKIPPWRIFSFDGELIKLQFAVENLVPNTVDNHLVMNDGTSGSGSGNGELESDTSGMETVRGNHTGNGSSTTQSSGVYTPMDEKRTRQRTRQMCVEGLMTCKCTSRCS